MSRGDYHRDEAARLDALFRKPEVIEAMRERCEADGHSFQSGIGIGPGADGRIMRVTSTCEWCGYRGR